MDKTEEIVSKCGGYKCYTCKQLKAGTSFYFRSYDQPFKVKQNMDCNSKLRANMHRMRKEVYR